MNDTNDYIVAVYINNELDGYGSDSDFIIKNLQKEGKLNVKNKIEMKSVNISELLKIKEKK